VLYISKTNLSISFILAAWYDLFCIDNAGQFEDTLRPVSNLKIGLNFILFDISVAKGPKFRPQNTKGAYKNCGGPGNSGAEFWANLARKGRKGAEILSCLILH
jgi:hypothetical protein